MHAYIQIDSYTNMHTYAQTDTDINVPVHEYSQADRHKKGIFTEQSHPKISQTIP